MSAPFGNFFTALLFGRLYRRRIKLYRGIHLKRVAPSFTVELRRRPRFATNLSQDPPVSETRIPQAPFERESHRVPAVAFEVNASTLPAGVASTHPKGRILQCLVPDEQPREVSLSSASSDQTSRPPSRRPARGLGNGDQAKKLQRNLGSSRIENTALQGTESTASHRSSAEPADEITGVAPSESTGAPNCARALIPKAKRRRETQDSPHGNAEPMAKDLQSAAKVDFVTTPAPTVVEPPRQSRRRNIIGRYVFGDEFGPGERWKRRLMNR